MVWDKLSRESICQAITKLNEEAYASKSSDPHVSLEKAREAETLSNHSTFGEDGYVEGKVNSLINQAYALLAVSDYGNGLRIALTANEKAQQSDPDSPLHSDALKVVAHLYLRMGDYPKALSHYQKILLIAEQLGDVTRIVGAQNGLGVIYGEMGDYEEAIRHFQGCLTRGEQLKNVTTSDRSDRAVFNSNICKVYRLMGQPRKGIPFGLNSLEMMERYNINRASAAVDLLNELGRSYSDLGENAEAERYYERAHQMLDDVPSKQTISQFHLGYATFLFKQTRLEEAQKSVEYALQLTKTFNGMHVAFQCHELLAKIARTSGAFETAYNHYEQFHTLQAALHNKENTEQIRLLRISHEVDVAQKESEIYRLRTNHALEALEQAKAADATRSNMIKTILHEFRTPLTVLSSSSGLLRRHSDKMSVEKKEKYYGRIGESIQYLSHLLNEVEKIEDSATGKLQPYFSPVIVNEWSKALIDDLRQSTNDQDNVTYIFDTADQTSIQIDTAMTKAIMLELVTNAIKYTLDEKPITVEMGVDGDDFTFTVADGGVGIVANEIDKIYELFYRAYRAGDIPGLGTGLYLVKAMVTALDGEIDVKSEGIDLGTIFSVTLPISQVAMKSDL